MGEWYTRVAVCCQLRVQVVGTGYGNQPLSVALNESDKVIEPWQTRPPAEQLQEDHLCVGHDPIEEGDRIVFIGKVADVVDSNGRELGIERVSDAVKGQHIGIDVREDEKPALGESVAGFIVHVILGSFSHRAVKSDSKEKPPTSLRRRPLTSNRQDIEISAGSAGSRRDPRSEEHSPHRIRQVSWLTGIHHNRQVLPSPNQWTSAQNPDYSGASAAESHRVPYSPKSRAPDRLQYSIVVKKLTHCGVRVK